MASQYRHTSHITYCNIYHIVWITKYRKKVLLGDIGLRLRDIIRQICNQEKVEILKGSIAPDYMEKLKKNPKNRPLNETVKREQQTNLVRREFPDGFRGYQNIYRCAELLKHSRNNENEK